MKKPTFSLALVGVLAALAAHGAVITVNTTDNTVIDPNDSQTNLVEALSMARAGDEIHFDIPGNGPHYLETPPNGYPLIQVNNLTIDGYTQPGAQPNTNPILAPNNAVIQIVLDSRQGGRALLNFDGYGTSESAILGVVGATGFDVRGLAFLGKVTGATDADPAIYCVSFGQKATDGHVEGCWMGVDPNGKDVYGAAAGVTGFQFHENGNAFGSDRITVGVAPGAKDPRAQFNVIVAMTIPVILEGSSARISGNFLGVLPDGLHDYNSGLLGADFEGHIEIGRDQANTVIGTDGDGVNDDQERNIFGGVVHEAYDTVIEFYGRHNQTNVVIAGNYFGVGIDGQTRFTNDVPIVNSFSSTSVAQIGSDLDGVSDAEEGNFVYANYPMNNRYPDPPNAVPAPFMVADPGALISVRGNRLVNNFVPPYSPFTQGFLDYYAPYVADTNSVRPTLSTNSSTAHLIGEVPLASADYPHTFVDLYLPDPEGITNGILFAFPEFPEGFIQGKTFLATYEEGSAEDLDPRPGAFDFDISDLGLSVGTSVTVTANFSKDPAGTHRGRTHTSIFSVPVSLVKAGTVISPLKFTGFTLGAGGLTLEWVGGTAPFVIQRKTNLVAASWEAVTTTQTRQAVVPTTGASAFFRIVNP